MSAIRTTTHGITAVSFSWPLLWVGLVLIVLFADGPQGRKPTLGVESHAAKCVCLEIGERCDTVGALGVFCNEDRAFHGIER